MDNSTYDPMDLTDAEIISIIVGLSRLRLDDDTRVIKRSHDDAFRSESPSRPPRPLKLRVISRAQEDELSVLLTELVKIPFT